MGKLKRYLLGIHHVIRLDNLARYLTAFSWQFNHGMTSAGTNGKRMKAIRPLNLKSLRHLLYT